MLIEFLGEILVEGVAYGTYGLMELFLEDVYKRQVMNRRMPAMSAMVCWMPQ